MPGSRRPLLFSSRLIYSRSISLSLIFLLLTYEICVLPFLVSNNLVIVGFSVISEGHCPLLLLRSDISKILPRHSLISFRLVDLLHHLWVPKTPFCPFLSMTAPCSRLFLFFQRLSFHNIYPLIFLRTDIFKKLCLSPWILVVIGKVNFVSFCIYLQLS